MIDSEEDYNSLKNMILENPNKVWENLKTRPELVKQIPRLKREYKKSEELSTEINLKIFFDHYFNAINHLYDLDHKITIYGNALVIEFISELWRKNQQKLSLFSFNDQLIHNLIEMEEEVEKINNEELTNILAFAINRIQDFEKYERVKLNNNWSVLIPLFNNMLQTEFNNPPTSNKFIPRSWKAIIELATSPTISLDQFRLGFAELTLDHLKGLFSDLTTEQKYEIAPYIKVLERITKK
ncbi:MAG: hypothetical protein OEZ01_00695 [Candidatus Heimdallarchaeota archaeon]|nr:hypothetical protein [Candidatus Heimdallarchaeota archaeon]MDH5644490.1 hypothetical protein [Candidatus Heimdallarchaeota archaeon]